MFKVQAKIDKGTGLENIESDLRSYHNNVKRRMGIDLLTKIVVKTPVDTGRARGGWAVALSANPAPTNAVDRNGSATIFRGLGVIQASELTSDIVIGNSVRYVIYLEEGRSQQAPQGMVKISIAEVEANFKHGYYG